MDDARYRQVMLTLWQRTMRFIEDGKVKERNEKKIEELLTEEG